MVLIGPALSVLTGIPVDPDAPHARQWLIDELAKPEYQAAKPSWFDLLAQAVKDWFASLTLPSASGAGNVFLIVAIVAVLALIVAAFLVFGVPRRARRTRTGTVLDADDGRTADRLRADAAAAAAAGRWSDAVVDRFRAIALALRERTVVTMMPGTTAHEVAERAAPVFPAHAGALRQAAAVFDAVRYLGRTGTADDYDTLTRLDDALRGSRPQLGPDADASALLAPR